MTDHVTAFEDSHALDAYDIKFIPVKPVSTLTRVWFIKCKLLEIVPPEYQSIMYMDSDIMATGSLDSLFQTIPVFKDGYIGMFNDVSTRFGLYGDNTYHGGVVLMQRNASESCLAGWCDRMEGHPAPGKEQMPWGVGEVEDDQIAMAAAVDVERTCQVWFLPDKHMLFMADFKSMLFGPRATFSHFTNAARRRLVGPWRWFWQAVIFSPRRVGQQCLPNALAAYTLSSRPVATTPARRILNASV